MTARNIDEYISLFPDEIQDIPEKEVKPYKWAIGSVPFPFDQPIPYKLISEMTKFRVPENREKDK